MRDYHRQRLENHVTVTTLAKLEVCEICRYILVAGAMAALVITYSWVRSEIISLGYQIQELKHDTTVLKEQRQALMLEQAACRSPQRIDQYARQQLGLIPANSARVIFIRDREVLPEQRMLAESIVPGSITSKETRQ